MNVQKILIIVAEICSLRARKETPERLLAALTLEPILQNFFGLNLLTPFHKVRPFNISTLFASVH